MVVLFLSLLSAGGGDLSAAAGRSMDALNRQMSFCTAAVQQHINMFGPLPLLGAQIWPQAALAAMLQQQQQLHDGHGTVAELCGTRHAAVHNHYGGSHKCCLRLATSHHRQQHLLVPVAPFVEQQPFMP